jgi:hypothetical protein
MRCGAETFDRRITAYGLRLLSVSSEWILAKKRTMAPLLRGYRQRMPTNTATATVIITSSSTLPSPLSGATPNHLSIQSMTLSSTALSSRSEPHLSRMYNENHCKIPCKTFRPTKHVHDLICVYTMLHAAPAQPRAQSEARRYSHPRLPFASAGRWRSALYRLAWQIVPRERQFRCEAVSAA